MRNRRRRVSMTVMLGVAACAAVCGSCRGTPPTGVQATTTPLIIEITGGFKYVKSTVDHEVDVAFLKSTVGACQVDQMGVDLTVKDGEIVSPSPAPADNTFDPGGAVVTFGDNGAEPLTASRAPAAVAPFHPANPSTSVDWEDLVWIPRFDSFYPNNPLNPNWRQLVDGRVVLNHGKLVAGKPSDDAAVTGQFQFKRASDGATFQQSVTDRAIYTARMPGDRIIVNLAHARSGISRIEIKPSGGRPVKLLLVGRHTAAAAMLHPGDTIKHYCAFYELLSPAPQMSERMLPVYIGDPSKPLLGAPSPGAYCPGEF